MPPNRQGQRCRKVEKGTAGTVLVEFEDRSQFLVQAAGLKRA